MQVVHLTKEVQSTVVARASLTWTPLAIEISLPLISDPTVAAAAEGRQTSRKQVAGRSIL